MKQVFSDWSNIKMNGTKSMIGHCLGAAGGLEAVATIQAIRTGWVHPTINQVPDGRPIRPLASDLPVVQCQVVKSCCSDTDGTDLRHVAALARLGLEGQRKLF